MKQKINAPESSPEALKSYNTIINYNSVVVVVGIVETVENPEKQQKIKGKESG